MDSGTIISDETFYTQSQIMVEKVPDFSAESLCLRQGMVTSGRWCHMTLLDHVTPVGEHINNIDKNIKFTIEERENNATAFLDMCYMY